MDTEAFVPSRGDALKEASNKNALSKVTLSKQALNEETFSSSYLKKNRPIPPKIETNGPGFMIRRLQQVSVSFFHDELRSLSLTPLQATVLRVLGKEDALDQVTLASKAVVDASTIKDVIHRLEQNKVVNRKQSSTDKRMKIVELTSTGRELLNASIPLANRAAKKLLSPLSEQERHQLLNIIAKIVNAHDPEPVSGVRTTWRRKKTDLKKIKNKQIKK